MSDQQQTTPPAGTTSVLPPAPVAPQQADEMNKFPAPSENYIRDAESKALNFMNPKRWQMMDVMAKTFIASNAMPSNIKNAPQLIMVMQAGFEAGLQPIEALNTFYFVNGKLSGYGEKLIALVRRAGHKVEFFDFDHEKATCKITRKDTGETMQATFTIQMATERGLTKNQAYRTAPENMLKFKAFHMIAKFIVPDALSGADVGEVIESEIALVEGDGKKTSKKIKAREVEITTDGGHKSLDEAIEEPDATETKKTRKSAK